MKHGQFSVLHAMLRRQVLSSAQRSSRWLNDGKLHVVLCGTGSPVPDPERVGACTAAIAAHTFILFDIGPGAARRADLEHLPLGRLGAVFLTHLHSDHIGDLGDVEDRSWRAGRAWPLDVYGPLGTEQVVQGFRQAYALDARFRAAHMGDAYPSLEVAHPVAHEVGISSPTILSPVYESPDGLKVSAFLVDHRPVEPAFGYRIEYRGRTVVISGDTRKNDQVIRAATGADLLIHEAFNKELVDRSVAAYEALGDRAGVRQGRGIQSYHTTTLEAAQVAASAGVQTLVITHIIPPLGPRWLRPIAGPLFLAGMAKVFPGAIVLGEDGMRFDLEPDEGYCPSQKWIIQPSLLLA